MTRKQICARACEIIPDCMTSTKQECNEFCFADLGDCSAAQMADTDACTDALIPQCDGDAWLVCITPISCLSTTPGQGPT